MRKHNLANPDKTGSETPEVEVIGKAETHKTTIIKGSIVMNVLLTITVVFMGLMLAKQQGCIGKSVPSDTSKLVIPKILDEDAEPDKLPKRAGVAEPTVDTTWLIKKYPLEYWWIYSVKYLNDAVSVAAVKPITENDSTYFIAHVATYFAPGGFRITVGDSIRVDTFPHYDPPTLAKSKVWHWKASLGFCWVAYDTTFVTFTAPFFRVGGELGPLRLGRTSVSITPVQVMWYAGGKSRDGVLAAGAEIEVKF